MRFTGRRFLMLQGPHGPFLWHLSQRLRGEGAEIWKMGVNAGDAAEWPGAGYLPLLDPQTEWPDRLRDILEAQAITDVVLYGEARPLHQAALGAARGSGVATHILEEGYLRPHWITYERQGSNASSPAADWPLEHMAPFGAAPDAPIATAPPPARWGALPQHALAGARYHLRLLAGQRSYPSYRSYRAMPIRTEAMRALSAALGLPLVLLWRALALRRLRGGPNSPLYVLLLQLEHDSALTKVDESLAGHAVLLDRVIRAFAANAPPEARLAIKMHPLEARRGHVARLSAQIARRYGMGARVIAVPGGRLAQLLNLADAALTICSTAGQQALWRDMPLYAFGRTVYSHDALLPEGDLDRFMAAPRPPDPQAYARFRGFLLRTSQIEGGFYTDHERAHAIAGLLSRLAEPMDPYDREAALADAATQRSLIPLTSSGQVAQIVYG